jgi:hypothetical protein
VAIGLFARPCQIVAAGLARRFTTPLERLTGVAPAAGRDRRS